MNKFNENSTNVNNHTPLNPETEMQQKQPKDPTGKKEKSRGTFSVIVILLLIIIIILLSLRFYGLGSAVDGPSTGSSGTTTPKPTSGLEIDDGEDWDGSNKTNFSDGGDIEYTTIPGFSDIVVNEKNKEIQLYNLEENTVYFVYTITNNDTGETVYETKAIAPGKATKWNVYDTMGKGTHSIGIEISTYDVVTQEQCYGAKQTVRVVVQ